MHDYLQDILINKQHQVTLLAESIADDADHQLNKILRGEWQPQSRKSFQQALTRLPLAVIAEIKRRSPSKSHLADIVDPVELAYAYRDGGATAISVLTESSGFGGCLTDLANVSKALADTPIAILRKDFILEEIQIAESILHGADAILLIVAVLQQRTSDLLAAARRMNIEVLVEVHDQQELEYALEIGADIIGVNNRNLTTFNVDLNVSRELIKQMPKSIVSIAESGIDSPKTGAELAALGYQGLLIGESLVKATQPQAFISQLQQHYQQLTASASSL